MRPGQQVGHDQYGAQEITADMLIGFLNKLDGANTTNLVSSAPTVMSEHDVHALSAYLLGRESGERFPVGEGKELIVLRFVCENEYYSLLAVEDYNKSYPVLVYGHITDRNSAIVAWLGDADETDHSSLYLR